MGSRVCLVFAYFYFCPIDLNKMITDMSGDYNKSNNTWDLKDITCILI